MRVHALFGRMSGVVGRLSAIGEAAGAKAAKLPAGDAAAARLSKLREDAEALRRQVVATKEGGAITGEERLREHADLLYGALLQWEGKPAPYQVERIAVLERELGDVERGLAGLEQGEVKALGLTLAAADAPDEDAARALRDGRRLLRGEVPDERVERAARERD
jgi:hypothetical protein